MKQLLIKATVFILILFGVLTVLDYYYTQYKINHKDLCEKSDWALNIKNQSFDFAFIGNSRVINMVDINLIETVTAFKGINLGLIGACYAENYLLLDQFLKNNNKLKSLIIQVDMHALNSKKELGYPFHNYNYMYLLKDPDVYETFKNNTEIYKLLLWKYIPFTRYMEFSNKYVLYKMLKGGFECSDDKTFGRTKGSELLSPKPFQLQRSTYSYWLTNPKDEAYLDKLISFCQGKNIQVILYTAPLYNKFSHWELNLANILRDQKIKAKKSGLPFFDYSMPENDLCKHVEDYNDYIHMNTNGVAKLSKALADSILPLLNKKRNND